MQRVTVKTNSSTDERIVLTEQKRNIKKTEGLK